MIDDAISTLPIINVINDSLHTSPPESTPHIIVRQSAVSKLPMNTPLSMDTDDNIFHSISQGMIKSLTEDSTQRTHDSTHNLRTVDATRGRDESIWLHISPRTNGDSQLSTIEIDKSQKMLHLETSSEIPITRYQTSSNYPSRTGIDETRSFSVNAHASAMSKFMQASTSIKMEVLSNPSVKISQLIDVTAVSAGTSQRQYITLPITHHINAIPRSTPSVKTSQQLDVTALLTTSQSIEASITTPQRLNETPLVKTYKRIVIASSQLEHATLSVTTYQQTEKHTSLLSQWIDKTPSLMTSQWKDVTPAVSNPERRDAAPSAISSQWIGVTPSGSSSQSIDVTPSIITTQRLDATPSVTSSQWIDVTPLVSYVQWMDASPTVTSSQWIDFNTTLTSAQGIYVAPSVASSRWIGATPSVISTQWMDVTPLVTSTQWMDVTPLVTSTQWMDATPSVASTQWMYVTPPVTSYRRKNANPSATNSQWIDDATSLTNYVTRSVSTSKRMDIVSTSIFIYESLGLISPVISSQKIEVSPSVNSGQWINVLTDMPSFEISISKGTMAIPMLHSVSESLFSVNVMRVSSLGTEILPFTSITASRRRIAEGTKTLLAVNASSPKSGDADISTSEDGNIVKPLNYIYTPTHDEVRETIVSVSVDSHYSQITNINTTSTRHDTTSALPETESATVLNSIYGTSSSSIVSNIMLRMLTSLWIPKITDKIYSVKDSMVTTTSQWIMSFSDVSSPIFMPAPLEDVLRVHSTDYPAVSDETSIYLSTFFNIEKKIVFTSVSVVQPSAIIAMPTSETRKLLQTIRYTSQISPSSINDGFPKKIMPSSSVISVTILSVSTPFATILPTKVQFAVNFPVSGYNLESVETSGNTYHFHPYATYDSTVKHVLSFGNIYEFLSPSPIITTSVNGYSKTVFPNTEEGTQLSMEDTSPLRTFLKSFKANQYVGTSTVATPEEGELLIEDATLINMYLKSSEANQYVGTSTVATPEEGELLIEDTTLINMYLKSSEANQYVGTSTVATPEEGELLIEDTTLINMYLKSSEANQYVGTSTVATPELFIEDTTLINMYLKSSEANQYVGTSTVATPEEGELLIEDTTLINMYLKSSEANQYVGTSTAVPPEEGELLMEDTTPIYMYIKSSEANQYVGTSTVVPPEEGELLMEDTTPIYMYIKTIEENQYTGVDNIFPLSKSFKLSSFTTSQMTTLASFIIALPRISLEVSPITTPFASSEILLSTSHEVISTVRSSLKVDPTELIYPSSVIRKYTSIIDILLTYSNQQQTTNVHAVQNSISIFVDRDTVASKTFDAGITSVFPRSYELNKFLLMHSKVKTRPSVKADFSESSYNNSNIYKITSKYVTSQIYQNNHAMNTRYISSSMVTALDISHTVIMTSLTPTVYRNNMDTSILLTSFKSIAPVKTGISSIIDSPLKPTFQNIAPMVSDASQNMNTSILSTLKSTAPVESGISSIIDSSVQPTFQNIAPMVRDTSLNMDTSILSTFKSTAPVKTGISSIIDSSVQPTFQNIAPMVRDTSLNMDTSILSTFINNRSTAPVETGISSIIFRIIDSSVQPTFQNIAPMVRDTSLNMNTSILSTFKSTVQLFHQ